MRQWAREVDRLLRGDFTSPEHLQSGHIAISIRTLVAASLALGAVYGFCMGFYRIPAGLEGGFAQLLSTVVKVPLLFVLTLGVTLPSLYVFSALFNSRLGLTDTVRLLTASVAVNMALLASFGPVTLFFTFCTESYPFMKLLNVFFFAVSGFIALGFLHKALLIVFEPAAVKVDSSDEASPAASDETVEGGDTAEGTEESGTAGRPRFATDPGKQDHDRRVRRLFAIWLVIYAVVGAQMGWILRPFIGSPDLPYSPFRERESNFFLNVLHSLQSLFS